MKSILNETTYNKIQERLAKLTENSKPRWGKMDAAQMAWHCQPALNIMLKKDTYGLKPNWFVKLFFKKSMYNDKPWGKNLPTAKVMKATEPRNFNEEIGKLKAVLNELGEQRNKQGWGEHPGFGHFTDEQWGQMQYKHLDHHLRQFGV